MAAVDCGSHAVRTPDGGTETVPLFQTATRLVSSLFSVLLPSYSVEVAGAARRPAGDRRLFCAVSFSPRGSCREQAPEVIAGLGT